MVYSNWGSSRKAVDVQSNPHAALTFWWKDVERQVRVEGRVERLSAGESQTYFDTRARGSRVGAWASEQSRVLGPTGTADAGEGGEEVEDDDDGRAKLEKRVRDVEGRFEGVGKIPVPEFWGGLRVLPDMVEFWQGRESRLHDRFRYERVQHGEGQVEWRIERLSP